MAVLKIYMQNKISDSKQDLFLMLTLSFLKILLQSFNVNNVQPCNSEESAL